MDKAVPRRHGQRAVFIVGMLFAVLAGAFAFWRMLPRGLQVSAADVRIAAVERGMFRDSVIVRATAAPLQSVMLDAVESGRVEEVLARDGALVKQGDLLFRLSNAQRRLELLARQSDYAQQISNLFNLRVVMEAGRAEHARRMSDLSFALSQARKQHARTEALARKGFISAAALDESEDRLAQQQQMLEDERRSGATDMAIKRDAVRQMRDAIVRMEAGLKLINETIEALAVRAPVAGQLTDFRLQVGEMVKPDQRIGRIDDPDRFKLSAQVDEYYLNRITIGRQGSAQLNGRTYVFTVSRIYPQIKDGRFAVEMAFGAEQPPSLKPGQSVEAHITLGESTRGLLLPNDAFVNDTGGTWVFVLDEKGRVAERRAVRTGRRSNAQVEVLSGLAPGERVITSSYTRFGEARRLQFTE
jgi:HlyD family secretion protein